MLKSQLCPFGSWLVLLLEGSGTRECLGLGAPAGMKAGGLHGLRMALLGTRKRQGFGRRADSPRVRRLSFHPGSLLLSSATCQLQQALFFSCGKWDIIW